MLLALQQPFLKIDIHSGQYIKTAHRVHLLMMTLRQIRHFIAVAETGSISAAAQTAFISQSTLTLAIQQLEEEIGVSLFR